MKWNIVAVILFSLCCLATVMPVYGQVTVTGETYYFGADTTEVNNVAAYELYSDFGNTAVSLSSSVGEVQQVTYGFRVYRVYGSGVKAELTSGAPEATITLTTNSSTYHTALWSCPGAMWNLGEDALEVDVYRRYGEGNYSLVTRFISDKIVSAELQAGTWSFEVHLTYLVSETETWTSMNFGNYEAKSSITGVSFIPPSLYDSMFFYLMNADIIAFLRAPLEDIFQEWAYFIIITGISAAFYIRYRNIGVILGFFVIFGATGGIVGVLLPSPVDMALWGILAFALTAILWKVFR